jgi:hypothetical protein
MRKMLDFNPKLHGWHFQNDISTDIAGPIRTYGLCGGMCLSALNYKRHGIKIPALKWDQIPASSKINKNGRDWINVPMSNPGAPHPVFDFIFHSQIATYQTANITKQFVFFTHDNDPQHHAWSVNEEFPMIKRAIDNNNFVILAFRSATQGDLLGHQCLVYGYDDIRKTLYMYDPNTPDKECVVIDAGSRIETGWCDESGNYFPYGPGNQYRSYYLLLELKPNVTSRETTYDFFRNGRDNFAVKPTYADPVYVAPAGSGIRVDNGVVATPARPIRR